MISDSEKNYTVEISFKARSGAGARPFSYDMTLIDGQYNEYTVPAVVHLDFRETRLSTGYNADTFIKEFLEAKIGGAEEGLAFGRLLFERLLGNGMIAPTWQKIEARRMSKKRPLRLELKLPTGEDPILDLPFELLADDKGFFFRRFGCGIVRTLHGLEARPCTLSGTDSSGLVWANTVMTDGSRIPVSVFSGHETAQGVLKLRQIPCCQEVTLPMLRNHLETHAPLSLLSIVAHGDNRGGAILLHKDSHPDYPSDPGQPISARDLASELKKAQVEVAFLWSCYGGKCHPVDGAVAQALLDPEWGDLSAIVGSHAALEAEQTPRIAEAVFGALDGIAAGDLETAIAEARARTLSQDHLQWAAVVYYARPLHWQSVSFENRQEELLAEILAERGAEEKLESAPVPTPYFRGRQDDVTRLSALMKTARLVSVVGLPGIGKTEVSLSFGQAAMEVGHFERGIWIPVDGIVKVESLRNDLALSFGMESCDRDQLLAQKIGKSRCLLLLDNAEDLIRPDGARLRQFLETLLRSCSELKILLSSRRRLGDAGSFKEELHQVMRLEQPFDREIFLAEAGERLAPEEQDNPILKKIIDLLGGHPRSLSLVAGRVGGMLTLEEIYTRLLSGDVDMVMAEDILGEDLEHTPDNLNRAKILISSLNLSYHPLREANPAAALAFAWLGLFPTGLPSILMPEIFGNKSAELQATLLREHLAEIGSRERRLELPAPIRWYARLQLNGFPFAQRHELLEKSLAAMGRWIDAAERLLGTENSKLGISRAISDEANIQALATAYGEHKAACLSGDRISNFLATLIIDWARIYSYAGRHAAVLPLLENTLNYWLNTGTRAEANTLKALGDLYVRTDRLREAEQSYQAALPIYREIEDRLGEANTLQALGDLYVRTARLREAEQSYQAALPIYREIEARLGEANTLQALGDLYVRTDGCGKRSSPTRRLCPSTVKSRLGWARPTPFRHWVLSTCGRIGCGKRSSPTRRLCPSTVKSRIGWARPTP